MVTDGPQRRLRIAYVVHDYNRHVGHSRYVAELASRFRHEHEIHVFTNRVEDPDTADLTFHHVPAWRANALSSILSFVIPATLRVRGTFDVVHAQGLCGLRHNVVTAHQLLPAWYNSQALCAGGLSWRQRLARTLITPLERRAICQPATRRVIAISELTRAGIERYYGRSQGVEVIYHGTDTVTFQPDNRERYRRPIRADLGLSEDGFVAIYVGDLAKGAEPAIRALTKTSGVTLLFVSRSDTTSYLRLAEAEGVNDRVIFHPASRHVERLFAAADALVFPTLHDQFGMVISEAMASGLPVITNRNAGAAELITDGEDGLLTGEPWDVSAIAERLARLRDDPSLRERMGAAARRRIEPLTWDRTAMETMAVYRSLVETGGGPT